MTAKQREAEDLMTRYRTAYQQVYDRDAPTLRYAGGWFYIDRAPYRRERFVEIVGRFEKKAAEVS